MSHEIEGNETLKVKLIKSDTSNAGIGDNPFSWNDLSILGILKPNKYSKIGNNFDTSQNLYSSDSDSIMERGKLPM